MISRRALYIAIIFVAPFSSLFSQTPPADVTVGYGEFLAACGTIDGNLINYGTVSISCGNGLHVTGQFINRSRLVMQGGVSLSVDQLFESYSRIDLLMSLGTILPSTLANFGDLIQPGDVKITSVFRAAEGLSVYVRAYDGHLYQLQRTRSLAQEWENVPSPGPTNAYGDHSLLLTDFYTPNESPMFYRVQVVQ